MQILIHKNEEKYIINYCKGPEHAHKAILAIDYIHTIKYFNEGADGSVYGQTVIKIQELTTKLSFLLLL